MPVAQSAQCIRARSNASQPAQASVRTPRCTHHALAGPPAQQASRLVLAVCQAPVLTLAQRVLTRVLVCAAQRRQVQEAGSLVLREPC
jgi:hypothetical protein